jgi:hypothetical protein
MSRFCSISDVAKGDLFVEPSAYREASELQAPQLLETTSCHGLLGRFSATVVSLQVDRAIIRSWLHSGLTLPEGDATQPHRVFLHFGRQELVSPMVYGRAIRFPFCYSYHEIIIAVSDLEIRDANGLLRASEVTYMPRLYLSSWAPTLLGRGFYGFSKSYATFDVAPNSFRATNRRGQPLLDAEIQTSECLASDKNVNGLPVDFRRIISQPIALGKGNRLNLSRYAFDLASAEIRPARVSLKITPELLSWMPKSEAVFPGCDEALNGAFSLNANWTLARYL